MDLSQRSTLAFFAAFLFLLAGIVQATVAWSHRGSHTSLAMGGFYIALAALWFALAAKWKKQARGNDRS